MLICHSRKFLFIHIQKTGGTTIRSLLRPIAHDARNGGGKHNIAIMARREMGWNKYHKYYTFAFVRNPWDRLVSWYSMFDGAAHSGNMWFHRKYKLPFPCDFETFLVKSSAALLRPQWHYVSNRRDKCMVNDVYRFENFSDEIRRLGGKLGVEFNHIPHRGKSAHRQYQEYYTPSTMELVAERFAQDIDNFGYTFE